MRLVRTAQHLSRLAQISKIEYSDDGQQLATDLLRCECCLKVSLFGVTAEGLRKDPDKARSYL